MSIQTHGISIGIERIDNQFFMTLVAKGKLTHADYEIITPMIDSALNGIKDPKVKMFFDGTEMEGWELHAAWDDLKLGLKHGNDFEKIAIYGNRKWQSLAAKVGGWFISGETKYFEDKDEALLWLQS